MLGRSRVSKLSVMRSLLSRNEDVHRPELYLDSERSDPRRKTPDQEEEIRREVPLVDVEGSTHAGHGRGDGVVGGRGGDDLGGSGLGGGRWGRGEEGERGSGRGGSLRYHQQLRRYREHLRREVRRFWRVGRKGGGGREEGREKG